MDRCNRRPTIDFKFIANTKIFFIQRHHYYIYLFVWNHLVPLLWLGPLTSAASLDLISFLNSLRRRQILLYLSVLITLARKTMLRSIARRTGIPRNQEWPWQSKSGYAHQGIILRYEKRQAFSYYLQNQSSTPNCSSAAIQIVFTYWWDSAVIMMQFWIIDIINSEKALKTLYIGIA